jgi:hypothetical protein
MMPGEDLDSKSFANIAGGVTPPAVQVQQWRQESELEDRNRRITDLELMIQTLRLENDSRQRRIGELEQWIAYLSEGTLVAAGGEREAMALKKQIGVVSSLAGL